MTVLYLTWQSPYLGKTVFMLRRGPGPGSPALIATALSALHTCGAWPLPILVHIHTGGQTVEIRHVRVQEALVGDSVVVKAHAVAVLITNILARRHWTRADGRVNPVRGRDPRPCRVTTWCGRRQGLVTIYQTNHNNSGMCASRPIQPKMCDKKCIRVLEVFRFVTLGELLPLIVEASCFRGCNQRSSYYGILCIRN